jgi:hypothetical protein
MLEMDHRGSRTWGWQGHEVLEHGVLEPWVLEHGVLEPWVVERVVDPWVVEPGGGRAWGSRTLGCRTWWWPRMGF